MMNIETVAYLEGADSRALRLRGRKKSNKKKEKEEQKENNGGS